MSGQIQQTGKLSPRFIEPFEVLERVGTVAYRLVLPSSLSSIHVVFHVSILRRYTLDPTHVMDWGELVVNADVTFKEGPMGIMNSRDQVFAIQDYEASEGVVVAPRSGRDNMGTQRHYACQLSFSILG